MRCKNCDYRLWNLRSRQCPECGRAFLPSEYDLRPNAVRFCCPHCSTAYYGTSAQGHLEPRRFACVTCGNVVDMDEMVLQPAEGVEEDTTGIAPLAWFDRKKIGTFRAWMRTVGRSMIGPAALIERVPALDGTARAWGFLMLTLLLIPLLGMGPIMLFSVIAGGAPGVLPMLLGIAVMAAVAVAGFALFALLWSAISHGLLRITGQTPHPASRTINAILYSSGPVVLAATPCVGMYLIPVGVIWWTVCAILAVQAAQRAGGLRATLVVGTFPGVFAVAAGAGFIALFAWGLRPGGAFSMTGERATTQLVATSVTVYALANNGPPAHAATLLEDSSMTSTLLTVTGSATSDNTITVAGTSLTRLDAMLTSERRVKLDAAVKAMPSDVVAHRLGDFVFTYHGVTLSPPTPGIWIVVLAPDPPANPAPPLDKVWVADAAGTVSQFRTARLAQNLKSQNQLRKQAGLPPLPDPFTVMHDKPVGASDVPP